MYKQTHKELINDIRIYIDHVKITAGKLPDESLHIQIADDNRKLHHFLTKFRNHMERDDHHTALILLCIVRRCMYKYLAYALRHDVDFRLGEAAFVLRDLEEYGLSLQVKEAVK